MGGIDYGMGKTNIDKKTEIRFGVIHQNECLQAWCDSSEPFYPEDCDENYEATGFEYNNDGYEIKSDEYGDLFITKSPYYTFCGFCSPCAPGAGYLTSDGNVKSYCLNHDWFEDNKAPYTVYSVETGEVVIN